MNTPGNHDDLLVDYINNLSELDKIKLSRFLASCGVGEGINHIIGLIHSGEIRNSLELFQIIQEYMGLDGKKLQESSFVSGYIPLREVFDDIKDRIRGILGIKELDK